MRERCSVPFSTATLPKTRTAMDGFVTAMGPSFEEAIPRVRKGM